MPRLQQMLGKYIPSVDFDCTCVFATALKAIESTVDGRFVGASWALQPHLRDKSAPTLTKRITSNNQLVCLFLETSLVQAFFWDGQGDCF